MHKPLLLGQQAERFALRHLKKQGLKALAKNYRSRFGEIDLIMQDREVWVFIEVRLRTHSTRLSGAESIDYFKQEKIKKTAAHYLQRKKCFYTQLCRFDVVDVSRQEGQFSAEWIKNAFGD